MKIAINGIGVAGPALAWWLKKYGYEVTLFEKAPKLRTGGYIVDFWGVGYDIAEKMGIIPEIKKSGYNVKKIQSVNSSGKVIASLNSSAFSEVLNARLTSVRRGDIVSILFKACKGVKAHFGVSIVKLKQYKNHVSVELSNGSKEKFDLVIGADGLHSEIRKQVFESEKKFEKKLGFYVAAFELKNYKPRNEQAYLMHAVVKRQVARFSMRNNETLFLLTFRSSLLRKMPKTEAEKQKALRNVFADLKWEVPEILERMPEVENIYFDKVSQIDMKKWTKGRVALVGDAGACVSLLAGEGTGLAIAEAYVLAGELKKANGDYQIAFRNYERILQEFIQEKQRAARGFAGLFAPKNAFSLLLRMLGIKLSNIPLFNKWILGNALRDNVELPAYEDN